MRPLDQPRGNQEFDGQDYGLARTVVAVRVAVVASIGVLLAIGPHWIREHAALTIAVLVAAMVYGAVLMAYPQLEVRRTRYSWLVTALDSAFTLALISLSGGVYSPVVAVLALAVIASAARLSFNETLLVAVLLGAAYVPVALTSSPKRAVTESPALQAGWSAVYLIFVAVITAGLSALAEREHRSRVRALVEAETEHAAAAEERDLRARLLRSYQSQQDGLQVLVHEFRTPVTSLEALTEALTSPHPMSAADRDASLRLVARHVHHLADMVDALSDVALSRRPTFSAGRVRRVEVADLIAAAADAAGLAPPRLRLHVAGDVDGAAVNAQGLRRIATNLLENASRHGRGEPVDVTCARDGEELVLSVLDRGPGIPPENLGEVTSKYVSLGGQRGTSGLGLWIVQQIAEAMGGRVEFAARDGGGLAATFRAPVA
ncbi:sensor histidine kinase [Mycobacterium sp. 050134]|uniref:sensor histidine kinase n=1 Tax=Mycobacterium sp. 050134 TaxID=3096111 RepID=UPI002EDA5A70